MALRTRLRKSLLDGIGAFQVCQKGLHLTSFFRYMVTDLCSWFRAICVVFAILVLGAMGTVFVIESLKELVSAGSVTQPDIRANTVFSEMHRDHHRIKLTLWYSVESSCEP